jgi:hypothetical protein
MNWTGSYWTATFPVSGFSQFFMHAANPGNVPLPVSLVGFDGRANDKENYLSWETSSEMNNAYFEVEYSRDALGFEAIGRVETKAENGNSQQSLFYNFTHKQVAVGHNYYRLKQVDIDGKTSAYSQVIDIQRSGMGTGTCALYPNPSRGEMTLLLETEAEQVSVMIYDMSGRLVRTYEKTVTPGKQQLSYNESNLADGIYTVHVQTNTERLGIFRWEKRSN